MKRLNSTPYSFVTEGVCNCDDATVTIPLGQRWILNLRPYAEDELLYRLSHAIGGTKIHEVYFHKKTENSYALTIKVRNPDAFERSSLHIRIKGILDTLQLGLISIYGCAVDGSWFSYTWNVEE